MRELIILAMGTSRNLCPYDAEVWGVNNGYKQVKEAKGHLDKLFLAHTQTKDAEGNNIFNWEEINKLGIDVINTHRVKGLKSRLYPMRRVVRKLGCDYFSDTICYMLVYAIDQATYKEGDSIKLKYPICIRLYGADMNTPDEYATEKGGIEYWIGFARGLGIKVIISDGSMLCKTLTGKPYGVTIGKTNLIIESYLKPFLQSTENVFVGLVPDDIICGIIKEGGYNYARTTEFD